MNITSSANAILQYLHEGWIGDLVHVSKALGIHVGSCVGMPLRFTLSSTPLGARAHEVLHTKLRSVHTACIQKKIKMAVKGWCLVGIENSRSTVLLLVLTPDQDWKDPDYFIPIRHDLQFRERKGYLAPLSSTSRMFLVSYGELHSG